MIRWIAQEIYSYRTVRCMIPYHLHVLYDLSVSCQIPYTAFVHKHSCRFSCLADLLLTRKTEHLKGCLSTKYLKQSEYIRILKVIAPRKPSKSANDLSSIFRAKFLQTARRSWFLHDSFIR